MLSSIWPRRRDRSDVEPLIAVDERHTNVVGGRDAATQSAAPRTGEFHAPDDYLLADQIMTAVERLARDLCRVVMPDTDWGVDNALFKDRYREMAWTAAAAGWRPPIVLAEQSRVATVARVLTDHELMPDDTCRCGWEGHYGQPEHDLPTGMWVRHMVWHAEHQAEQLVALGVLA